MEWKTAGRSHCTVETRKYYFWCTARKDSVTFTVGWCWAEDNIVHSCAEENCPCATSAGIPSTPAAFLLAIFSRVHLTSVPEFLAITYWSNLGAWLQFVDFGVGRGYSFSLYSIPFSFVSLKYFSVVSITLSRIKWFKSEGNNLHRLMRSKREKKKMFIFSGKILLISVAFLNP